jgi:hypothetical protein
MTSLNISNNNLGQLVPPKGWRVEVQDGGNAYFGPNGDASWDKPAGSKPEGIIALANAIPNMGAISQFTFSGDRSDSKPVTMETSITEADFSGKGLGLSGAIMLSAFLPKCT